MQPEDKQALTSCFCYWTPVISSDWHLVGALVFTLSSAIVHFLIRNLSNRSVHLRVTEKPPPFSLTAFPLPPVLQQPRSSFEFAPGNGRTRVTQYLKKKSAEESGRSIKDKVFILPKQNEFLNLFSKDKCICLDTISSHLLCSTRGHLWLPKHHTPPNSKVVFPVWNIYNKSLYSKIEAIGPWSWFLRQQNQAGNQIFSGKSLHSFCFLLFHPPTFSGPCLIKFFYLSTVLLSRSHTAVGIFTSPTAESV